MAAECDTPGTERPEKPRPEPTLQAPPFYPARDEHRLAKAQHRLSRKQKGSRNRSQARRKVARLPARIADRRRDFTHKRTTRLIRENQVVCAEGLNVKGMLAQPTLAQSIADVGWGELLRPLEYKARWSGRAFSSMA